MNRFVIESVGTFFIVLTTGLVTVQPTSPLTAAVAIAGAYTAAIYAGGRVVNAHYNPAISLGFFIRGRIPQTSLRDFLGAQLGAAIVGGLAAVFLRGGSAAETTSLQDHVITSLTAEFLFTFVLAWVVLSVTTDPSSERNHYGPLAVGLVVLAGGIAVGEISHAALNPAVALAMAVMKSVEWSDLWVYLVADFGGAAAAAALFNFLQSPPDEETTIA